MLFDKEFLSGSESYDVALRSLSNATIQCPPPSVLLTLLISDSDLLEHML